ncbi:MAG: family 43 glycosylhydrolase, partial [Victivallaceae bacterium]|nr:family 43 glycosylhydrolase [Victivallaceae bacterium]
MIKTIRLSLILSYLVMALISLAACANKNLSHYNYSNNAREAEQRVVDGNSPRVAELHNVSHMMKDGVDNRRGFVGGDAEKNKPVEKSAKLFSNKNTLVKTCADPFILKHDGVYYLYCTADTHLTDLGIPVYKSTDLVNWEGPCGAGPHGLALYKDDVWGDRMFWGGDVVEKNGKFYMYPTVEEHLVVAVSDSPIGPFVQKDKKPMHESPKEIDGSVFIDDDGKAYIYFIRLEGGNKIFVAKLSDDML